MPGGRPTKYKPEYDDLIVDLMVKKGMSLVQVAAHIGVERETVRDWGKANPSFGKAMALGRDGREAWWQTLNQNQALKGKGSSSNTIFTLKAQFGWKDKDVDLPDATAFAAQVKAAMLAIEALDEGKATDDDDIEPSGE